MKTSAKNEEKNSLVGIGGRIKRLRLEKKLTQSDLAGEEITRNMLCLIEKGSALPSLSTLVYIAERLDVPCGCLFDDTSLSEYFKHEKLLSAREYVKQKQYQKALDAVSDESDDDEIALIKLECDLALAKANAKEGKYEDVLAYLTDAMQKTSQTVYSTSGSGSEASLYYDIAKNALPHKEIEEDLEKWDFSRHLDLYVYIKLMSLFEENDIIKATNLASVCELSDITLSRHIAAKLDMARGRYNDAVSKLEEIVYTQKTDPTPHGSMILFKVFDDLEACAKAQGDYVSAYTYKKGKLELYEFTSGIKL